MTDQSRAAGFSPGYRSYVLLVLTLIYVVNYLDRQILGILLPYIQKEFKIDDFQAGLLSGTVFAVIYATLNIPLAVLADRMNRRNIIAASLSVFSLMTVLSGLATRIWHLLLARFFTGIGEAGTGPSINSTIADLYPPEKRAGALAFYSAGLNIGLLIGFFGGSWMLQHYGWRSAFIASGAPGLLLVLLLLFTVREPARGMADGLSDNGVDELNALKADPRYAPDPWWRWLDLNLRDFFFGLFTLNLWRSFAGILMFFTGRTTAMKFIWSRPAFRWIALGCSMSAFGGYANLYFIPKFLLVSHHMTPIQIGLVLSLLTGVCGAIGTYASGVVADRLGRRGVNWYMYVPIICTFIAVPCAPIFFLVPNTTLALCAAIIPSLMGAVYLGPSYAMAQSMVPLRLRSQTVGILLFILNLIALGLGPATVGFLSVHLKPYLGEDSLRYALLAGVVTALIGAFCYWRATRTLRADLTKGTYPPAKS